MKLQGLEWKSLQEIHPASDSACERLEITSGIDICTFPAQPPARAAPGLLGSDAKCWDCFGTRVGICLKEGDTSKWQLWLGTPQGEP